MKEIIKALSKDVIVGLRTIDDSYDNIYYGKIIKLKFLKLSTLLSI